MAMAEYTDPTMQLIDSMLTQLEQGGRVEPVVEPMDPFVRRRQPQVLERQGAVMAPAKAVTPLTDLEIRSILEREIQDALGHISSFIAEDRRKALSYYYGRPFGNEQEGRSQIILTDVLDTVEWILPTLIRMFLGGDKVWRFTATRPGEDAQNHAAEATAFINNCFLNEMDGFMVAHDWMKTALIEKNGFVRAFFEELIEPKHHTYRGLNQRELDALLEEDKGTPVAFEEYTERVRYESGEYVEEPRFDVKIRNIIRSKSLKVEGVPPEEVLIARRVVKIDDRIPFIGIRRKETVSDLISQGFHPDVVLSVPSDDSPEFNQARTERLSADETFPVTTAERADAAARTVWTTECYLPIDEDGDGYTELRKFKVVGDSAITILDDEEVNHVPIASLCPVPMPYKFFGLSVADLVMDLQLIRSTLLRQMLDNLYLQNNARTEVVEDMVELDDLLESTPGGIVRVEEIGHLRPIEVKPLGPEPFQTLEYLETVRENRTGITRYNQGLDASSLNQTATGVTSIMAAAAARVEMIARIFASDGFKRLGKILLRLFVESPIKERAIRLNGEWTSINPSVWDADMDVEIEVGLGVGQAAERITFLKMVMDLQERLAGHGFGGLMVKPENVFNVTERLTEAMGFNVPELFFTNPNGQEPPPPPPDPQIVAVEQKREEATIDARMRKLNIEVDQQRNLELAEFRVLELDRKMELEREKIASQERIEMAKIKAQRDRPAIQMKEAA